MLDYQQRTGLGRYTINLIKKLVRGYEDQFDFVGSFEHLNKVHTELPHYDFEYANKLMALIGNVYDLDLIFSPFFPIPEHRNFKGVLTIHDLIPLKLVECYKDTQVYELMDQYIRNTVKHIEHIIAVSNHTKNDIIELFSVEEERITVIHPGLDNIFLSKQEINNHDKVNLFNKYNIDKPYILSVCSFEPRKNLDRILSAYEKLRDSHHEQIGWVLVGGGLSLYAKLLSNIQNSKYNSDIVITGYIPDQDLLTLYTNAECLIYPSLYEGFGLPVIEAMACGTPVVISNSSSLREVGGNLAVYCNPYNVDSIFKGLEEILLCEKRKQANEFKKWASQFSWEKAGEQTRNILFTIANGR
ncbi:glycosyltransferase family 4 protein [Cytobacillus sp. Hm23]